MKTRTEWIESQIIRDETPNELVSRLNTPIEMKNPIEPKIIPAPISLTKIRESVSDQEAFSVLNLLIYDKILEAIKTDDLNAIQYHIKALYAGGIISDESVNKLTQILSETIVEPNYTPTIISSLAAAAGYDTIMVHEVHEILGIEAREVYINE